MASFKMPVKAQIVSTAVDSRSGEKDGKAWSINEQEVWLHLPSKPFPVQSSMRLASAEHAFAEGDYIIDLADCLTTDRFNKLSIDDRKIKLQSVKAQG